jgi:hypothetical protein
MQAEWLRTEPDVVVYVPQGEQYHDTDNEHFLVFPAPRSDELLAMWTQSSCEGRGDNRIMLARSADAQTWSEPAMIAGTTPSTGERQASWGFPVVADSGRIYCFYTREVERYDVSRQGCGTMGCHFSDDNGVTWVQGTDIPMPRSRHDHPDPGMPKNWIVWQKPARDRLGKWFVGYTLTTSGAHQPEGVGWWHWDSRCYFMRFENIDTGPDPDEIEITWLPEGDAGLEVEIPVRTGLSSAQEPSVVLLPDGRLFATMRTLTGYVYYAISEDDGARWSQPEILRYSDGGAGIEHPLSCCPLYAMDNAKYLLLFHNNPGRRGDHDQLELEWKVNHLNFLRNPMFCAIGQYRPGARQPIWFGEPHELFDTQDVPVGPKATAEVATYTSMTEWHGKRVLWYPDRKYFLLGKYISDGFVDAIG